MVQYPDFDIERAQALSFIFECALAQKAFEAPPFGSYVNIIRYLIESADRLADNCHMPEFTNHALPHICSIIQRASAWAVADGWIDFIDPQEAGYLLAALVIHDLGMLSQDARDLPDVELVSSRKGMSDLPSWVRRTHVSRLPKLVRRMLVGYRKDDPSLESHLEIIIQTAASHSTWPWQKEFDHNSEFVAKLGLAPDRLRGLNAVVAAADLLDEDCKRCDTDTLIRHKYGSSLNVAHWIRHSMTASVDDVCDHSVRVHFRRFPNEPKDIEVAYRVLHNHYRLILLYKRELAVIGAEIKEIVFDHSVISNEVGLWEELPDFKYCLVSRLLSTFGPEARNQAVAGSEDRKRLDQVGMECVDLEPYQEFLTPHLPRTDEERVLLQIIKGR